MADFEFFNPSEGGESYDPAAFERFKEKIKKNAAFIAAARKSEQKQKEKEDRLAKILLKFIQTNQKSAILMLAAKLLEENIPPSFILAIILLGNEEVQLELKRETQFNVPQLEASKIATEFSLATRKVAQPRLGVNEVASPSQPLGSLRPAPAGLRLGLFADSSLPLKVKAEIDEWGKGMLEAGSSVPFRVLETALTADGHVKKIVIDCAANVLDDFLAQNGAKEITFDTCFSFCEFLMQGVMQRLQKQIENQKELI